LSQVESLEETNNHIYEQGQLIDLSEKLDSMVWIYNSEIIVDSDQITGEGEYTIIVGASQEEAHFAYA
jgi:hypothetical protein